MRIAIGGVWHETNTFVPAATTLDDFRAYQYQRGDELLDAYTGTGTELGGMIGRAGSDVELVPLGFAAAVPSGTVEGAAFDHVLAMLDDEAGRAGVVDGLCLVLHGAMVSEGREDPESDLVDALHARLGRVPTTAVLDLHANISERLCRTVDGVTVYRTFPHVDMADRGAEALALVLRMIAEGERPGVHLAKAPLLSVPQGQETASEPMREILAAADDATREPGVWAVGVAAGYPYSDVPRLGLGVAVTAVGDAGQAAADAVASIAWRRRHEFPPTLEDVASAVDRPRKGGGPTVLVDVADNVGGGSPGDGTSVLQALEVRGRRDAVVVLWDPEAVAIAHEHGDGEIELEVGGKATDELGEPVGIRGTVRCCGAVEYRRTGRYMRGQRVALGRVAVVESAAGHVVLTEARAMPFDDDHLRVLGIDPERAGWLVAKGAIAWKDGFGAYAAEARYLRTPGYCPSDLTALAYRDRPRPAYPLEPDAAWTPGAPAATTGRKPPALRLEGV